MAIDTPDWLTATTQRFVQAAGFPVTVPFGAAQHYDIALDDSARSIVVLMNTSNIIATITVTGKTSGLFYGTPSTSNGGGVYIAPVIPQIDPIVTLNIPALSFGPVIIDVVVSNEPLYSSISQTGPVSVVAAPAGGLPIQDGIVGSPIRIQGVAGAQPVPVTLGGGALGVTINVPSIVRATPWHISPGSLTSAGGSISHTSAAGTMCYVSGVSFSSYRFSSSGAFLNQFEIQDGPNSGSPIAIYALNGGAGVIDEPDEVHFTNMLMANGGVRLLNVGYFASTAYLMSAWGWDIPTT